MSDHSDTHTSLFTRVPAQIERKWELQSRDMGLLGSVKADTVECSVVKSVKLIIEYNDMLATEVELLTEEDDQQSKRINPWMEAQKFYRDLTASMSASILELNKSILGRAKKEATSKAELLTQVRTRVFEHSTRSPTIRQDQFEQRYDRESSIAPRDSLSQVTSNTQRRTYTVGGNSFFVRPRRRS